MEEIINHLIEFFIKNENIKALAVAIAAFIVRLIEINKLKKKIKE